MKVFHGTVRLSNPRRLAARTVPDEAPRGPRRGPAKPQNVVGRRSDKMLHAIGRMMGINLQIPSLCVHSCLFPPRSAREYGPCWPSPDDVSVVGRESPRRNAPRHSRRVRSRVFLQPTCRRKARTNGGSLSVTAGPCRSMSFHHTNGRDSFYGKPARCFLVRACRSRVA